MTPTLELQRTIVLALKADVTLAAIVGDRVYDRAPQNVVFPFVQIGEMQQVTDDADCVTGFEVYIDIHSWSRSYGAVECRQMTSAVHTALHDVDLVLTGATLNNIRMVSQREITDPDGETTHGVSTFRALVDMA